MADELFDNNIASEMTLGEAIVRGILNEPKYVLSVFAYQNDYNRIKSRVRRAKNKVVRDQAERYLEALRRALEMADGLDVIFDKHITERTGKYIVFCSNIEHLKEMQGKIHKWFDRIDKAPHSYTAYSDDPTTDKAFAEFKGDSSDHLKLLFAKEYLSTLDKAKWSSCYVSPDGYKIGAWLRGQQRAAQRNGIDPLKRDMLMAIGLEL